MVSFSEFDVNGTVTEEHGAIYCLPICSTHTCQIWGSVLKILEPENQKSSCLSLPQICHRSFFKITNSLDNLSLFKVTCSMRKVLCYVEPNMYLFLISIYCFQFHLSEAIQISSFPILAQSSVPVSHVHSLPE
jgi:hypothetical protein